MTRDPDMTKKHDENDLVAEDDAVIGQALRSSLVVITGIALAVTLVIVWSRRPDDTKPETVIETSTPEVVKTTVELPAIAFSDVTATAGIDFVHFSGAEGEKLLPESMGSGAAFFDYDGDSDPDLLLINSTSWPRSPPVSPAPTTALYRNDGSGSFEDVSPSTGMDLILYGTGVAVGDFDADGRLDVFISAVGENRLLHNLGDRFQEPGAPAQHSSISTTITILISLSATMCGGPERSTSRSTTA
jgi:hypothetical protein